MEDDVIVDMFFERQEAVLAEVRRKYGLRLFRTAMNILHNKEDAEECVNDTLLKAWETIPPTRPVKFGAFLAKTSRNLSINKWKAKAAAKRGGGETSLLLSELEECIPAAEKPEDEYEAKLAVEAINSFLSTMEQTARAAFILRHFHGESIRAISERFQMNESKVKSILFRARNKLKQHLEKEGIVL